MHPNWKIYDHVKLCIAKNISDDVLEDTYNIAMLVKFMKTRLITYDIHSVFKILHPVAVDRAKDGMKQ